MKSENKNANVMAICRENGRIAIVDTRGVLLCSVSEEDINWKVNVQIALAACDMMVGYHMQELLAFFLGNGMRLSTYDYCDISSYISKKSLYNREKEEPEAPAVSDMAEIFGFPSGQDGAEDHALIFLRVWMMMKNDISSTILYEKWFRIKERGRRKNEQLINWWDAEYCQRQRNLVARCINTDGTIEHMLIHYDMITTVIFRFIERSKYKYFSIGHDEDAGLHIKTGFIPEGEEALVKTMYKEMIIYPVISKENDLPSDAEELFEYVSADADSRREQKELIDSFESYLSDNSLSSKGKKLDYEDLFNEGFNDLQVAHYRGVMLSTVISRRLDAYCDKKPSFADIYIKGNEKEIYDYLIKDDLWKKTKEILSRQVFEEMKEEILNETGKEIDYISALAVYKKLRAGGPYPVGE